jgi:hypothetical protein
MFQLNRIVILSVTVFLVYFAGCSPQPVEFETASLFEDGAWALYSMRRVNTDGTTSRGTLRIAAVGNEILEGKMYHWLEKREDTDEGVIITKFLAREKPDFDPDDGFTFWDDVKDIIIQEDMNVPERIPQQHLRRFTPAFIESSSVRRYGNIENIEPPTKEVLDEKMFTANGNEFYASGVRKTNHFVSSVNLGFLNLEDTTESFVEYYSHPDVPFGGIVSVLYKSSTESVNKLRPDTPPRPPQSYENSMTIQSFGTGAESQIVGQPVEKQVMPFPFLEAAQQQGS